MAILSDSNCRFLSLSVGSCSFLKPEAGFGCKSSFDISHIDSERFAKDSASPVNIPLRWPEGPELRSMDWLKFLNFLFLINDEFLVEPGHNYFFESK
jgi:hypothetical protein